MFHIVICDDDKGICAQIENILLEYSRKFSFRLDIKIVYSGEDLVALLQKDTPVDLIYLDIEMGAVNGIAVGTHIRSVLRNHRIEIVYVSGRNDYDRQLFDVQPLHFIAKPIDARKVIADLNLAIERTSQAQDQFGYRKGAEARFLTIDEIIYFESLGRMTRVVTTSGEDSFYSNMEEIVKAVSAYRFLRVHRSYLINHAHIHTLRYADVVMSNGQVIVISRSKQKEIRNLLL